MLRSLLITILAFASLNALANDQLCTKSQVEKIVSQACALYKASGEGAYPKLRTALFYGDKACGTYVTIEALLNGGTKNVFHPSMPELKGVDITKTKDFNGKPFGQLGYDCLMQPNSSEKCWVQYYWPMPTPKTGNFAKTYASKCTLFQRCGEKHLLTMGVYYGCAELGLSPNEYK